VPRRGACSRVDEAARYQALDSMLALIGAVLAGILAQLVINAILTRLARRTPLSLDDAVVRYAHRPMLLLAPTILLVIILPSYPLPPRAQALTLQLTALIIIFGVAWLIVSTSRVVEDAVQARFRAEPGAILARRVNTQVRILRGAAAVLVWIVAGAAMLMTFPRVRELGASLLASAGVAGLVVGLAARPVLENLIAGVQLAMTQPIRLDDAVVIDGQFGYIEEIKLTYIVVRLWDERRIIAPLTYFIQKNFENWSYRSSEVVAAATVVVKATVPVDDVRAELKRILDSTPLWTGRQWALQVTNLTDATMELRATMSAADAARAWDLRCLVREGLIRYVQSNILAPTPAPAAPAPPARAPDSTPSPPP
jgi:small-conductance mechanosensitive channel